VPDAGGVVAFAHVVGEALDVNCVDVVVVEPGTEGPRPLGQNTEGDCQRTNTRQVDTEPRRAVDSDLREVLHRESLD